MKFKFFKKKRAANRNKKEMKENVKIFYLCDGEACEKECMPECKHTSDIRHAKNFDFEFEDCYVERER